MLDTVFSKGSKSVDERQFSEQVCTKSSDGLANAAKELSFHLFRGT
jgi:hypothetical protein